MSLVPYPSPQAGRRAPASSIALLLLAGCAPQDGTVDGNWFAWLAANSSPVVGSQDAVPDLSSKATVFECARGWDDKTNDWEPGYIGPRSSAENSDRFIGGDCDPQDKNCDEQALAAECAPIDALQYHTFLQDDGYYAIQGEIKPWRTEAVVTTEGDFQVTSHLDLGNGMDFRFAFSIKPDFAPVVCTSDSSGNPVVEYVDGAPWLEKWSEDEEGYTIYYLNAGGVQTNPSDSTDLWYIDRSWQSGYGYAKLSSKYDFGAGEEFASTPPEYRHVGLDRENPDWDAYQAAADQLRREAVDAANEMVNVAGAHVGDQPAFQHKVEDNMWRRPIDTSDSGLDGWMELESSWVRIKGGSDLEPGGRAEGDYQILFSGSESASVLLVTGSFDIDHIRQDNSSYPVAEGYNGYSFSSSSGGQNGSDTGSAFCGGADSGL